MNKIVTQRAVFLVGLTLSGVGILRASVVANSTMNLTQLQILPSSGSLSFLSPITATGFSEALDSLGGLDQQFNSADDGDTATTALSGLAAANAAASAVTFTASASSGVNIHQIESFGSSTARASLSGTFEILGSSSPVNVQFLASLDLSQALSTLDGGLSATSELAFTLNLDNGDQPLFLDRIVDQPAASSSSTSSSTPLSGNSSLLPDTVYSFVLQLDSETTGTHSPEPATLILMGAGLCAVAFRRLRRGAVFVLCLTVISHSAHAKSNGGNNPERSCPTCSCTSCPNPQSQASSAAGTSVSLTMGNLSENLSLATVSSAFGPTLSFSAMYNSYNADGSRAQVDTGMGYGWTHSYNIFLFSQLGAMFRFDGDGRITRYKVGPGGSYIAAPGYFETLVKNADNSFTLTQKDQTSYTFATVPNTPFLVGGPVLRLIRIVDRNGNTTTLTYSAGNLTTVTDTYGRSLRFTYNSQARLTSITDPAGRTTTFQYDSTGRKLTRITDATNHSVQYTYNLLYQLSGKVDRDGRTFSYGYVNNMPTAVYDSTGLADAVLSNPNNWAVDPAALASYQTLVYLPSITSLTDGRGNVWRYQYDSNGYVTRVTAPDGATASYSWDASTLMVASRTDANGHTTTYAYDSQGNRIQMTDAMGFVTTYTYEPIFNMMTSLTDAKGRTSTYSYDARGNRIQETDPLGQTRRWTYDAHGKLLSQTDQNGHTTTHQYDANGNRTRTIDPLGNLTIMTYDAVGNRISRTDANGHTTTYQYDGLNRLTIQTDPLGHTDQTTYNGEGDRAQVTDRNGHSTTYQYDLRRRLIQETDAAGKPETYSYDGNDKRVSMTDRNGHTTAYGYDVQNRRIRITDALGNVTRIAYDPAGNRIGLTDANGHTTAYSYDPLNRVVTETDAAGDVTRSRYDTDGITPGLRQATVRIDANGKYSYFQYDTLNRLTTVIRKVGSTADTITPADAVIRYGYDPVGNRVTLTEPDGNTTTYQYDADNRRVRETNAAGDVTLIAYDGVDNVIGTTAPNGNVTTNAYDADNRLTQVTDSAGAAGSHGYDPAGNRIRHTDGNGNTTAYGYDALNRVTAITDALGHTATTQYDAVGNPTATTDRNGNVTTRAYDAINRRISTTDALNHTTQSQYDAVGNLVRLTDANGHATQYGYDAVNRRTQETYADGKTRTYTHDGVGNLQSRTDQMSQTTTYLYNDLYFLVGRTYPSSLNDTYTFDLSGRMLTAQRGSWSVGLAYDGANRVTQSLQNGRAVRYTYDIPGRTRTITYPGGRVFTEHTDARVRLDHIDDAGSPPIVQYSYDPGNRVVARSYRNGISAAYSYNADNWILSLQHSRGATPLAGFGYLYDNEGNKQFENKLADNTHSESYQYDSIYRLVTYKVGTLVGSTVAVPATQTAYNLDPVGNWTSKTTDGVTQNRTHDSVNELIQIDAAVLSYSSNGNLQGDAAYSYAYDEENRLTQVTRKSDHTVAGQYQYDALGRRVQKIANTTGSSTTTAYFYDDQRILEEQSAAGATLATYTYGNYIDEVLTMERAGQTYSYHQNALWSVESVTDSAGNTVERYAYDAYGAVTVTDGAGTAVPLNARGTPHSAIGNPSTFTGRQLDEETGLYFYRARYLHPSDGRFVQRDPKEYIDGMNLYEYVQSKPVNMLDPTGLCCCTGCTCPVPTGPCTGPITTTGTKACSGILWCASASCTCSATYACVGGTYVLAAGSGCSVTTGCPWI